jgi:hypothetical protein
MAAQAIAINELEWRNAAVTASAGRVISNLAKQPASAVIHYRLLAGVRTVNGAVSELLTQMHSEASIAALEAALPEQRVTLGQQLENAHDKIRMMIATLRVANLGYWKRFYTPKLDILESWNRELRAHSDALKDTDASLLILSKGDQEFLLDALLNPKEPSEDLRRTFSRG